MSEEQKLQTVDTYNPNDIIKGIEVSTAYIQGLQRMLTAMFLNYSEGTEKLPDLFKTFEQNLGKKQEDKTSLNLNAEQADIYTLFSLLQLFKYHANAQGLAKKTQTSATIEELKEIATMISKQEDVSEKLKELQSKMKIID